MAYCAGRMGMMIARQTRFTSIWGFAVIGARVLGFTRSAGGQRGKPRDLTHSNIRLSLSLAGSFECFSMRG